MASEQAIREAATSFFKQYDWNWWCTLTFKGKPPQHLADKTFKKWLNKLNRRTFGNNYYKRSAEGLRWMRTTERQRRASLHFHVAIAGDPKPAWDTAEKFWEQMAGDAQVRAYDPERGGIYYMLKNYASTGNVDMGGPWRQIPPQFSGVVSRPTQCS